MKTKVWVSVLVFSFFVCTGNLAAKERHGAELVIQKQDGQQVSGELIAVKENSLLLLESETGADISIDIDEIIVITVVKESKVGAGLLAGGVVGATVGFVLINQDYWLPVTKSGLFYLSVAVGVLGGILTGAGMGRDYAYKIEGKKPEELKNILKELRSEARLTNVQ